MTSTRVHRSLSSRLLVHENEAELPGCNGEPQLPSLLPSLLLLPWFADRGTVEEVDAGGCCVDRGTLGASGDGCCLDGGTVDEDAANGCCWWGVSLWDSAAVKSSVGDKEDSLDALSQTTGLNERLADEHTVKTVIRIIKRMRRIITIIY